MSGNLIEFLKLYEATSSNGKRYYRGRLNGLRLVVFPVDAAEGQDAHLQVYVSAGDERGGLSTGRNQASSAARSSDDSTSRQQRGGGRRYQDRKPSRQSAPSNKPPPFDDDLPFGA